MNWKEEFEAALPALGHRNWVVVADAAFPQQTALGINVVVTEEDLTAVLSYVAGSLKVAKHVHPEPVMAGEFFELLNSEVPGVNPLRERLMPFLNGLTLQKVWHQELLEILSSVGQNYSVLFLKTKSTIPYSSVAFRLECGYWSAEQETNFRKRLSETAP